MGNSGLSTCVTNGPSKLLLGLSLLMSHLGSLGRHIHLSSSKCNMQPSRRSARMKQVMETTETASSPSLSTGPSSSRKRHRKRTASSTAPPPKSSLPHAESLSASSEDEGDNFLPKEPRYEASREIFEARAREFSHLMRPKRTPITARFISVSALERYQALKPRKFINQQRLSLTDEKLFDVKKVVVDSGLIYTLIDSDSYQPTVVREFVAKLLDAEERDDGVAVYVRGSLVDVSPSLINSMYCIPGFEEDPNWLDENIDHVCGFLTDNRIRRWENMSSKYLTATNQVLYKLVCSNWIPTMNYTTMNQERLRFIYMLYHHRGFDFGKIVYNQIMSMAETTKGDKKRRIIFQTLIQQVLLLQRIVPPDTSDVDITGFPKLVVKDKKIGIGSGADSRPPNLEEDIASTIASLKAIRIRLRSKSIILGCYLVFDLSNLDFFLNVQLSRGRVCQYVVQQEVDEDEDEDGDVDEDSDSDGSASS